LPVGRQGMLGRAHRRPLVRPQPTPHSQPLHTRSPGPTPPQTRWQRTSAPRAGSAAGQPAVAAGCDRSLRDRPHPSARRPCGATVTGHPSAGTRNWHTPSTMGDQLGQPRSTRKRRTVNPPIVPARYNLSLPFLKAGPADGRLRRPPSGQVSSPASRASRAASACWSRRRTAWGGLGLTALGVLQQLVHATQQVRHRLGNLKASLSHDDGTVVPVSP
jgi:hypothetical protein